MPVMIIGGIVGGVFTVTESAAVAVVYALLIGFLVTRRLTPALVYQAMLQTGLVTSAALLIVATASLFAWLLTLLQVPQTIGAWIGT